VLFPYYWRRLAGRCSRAKPPALALAGRVAAQTRVPVTSGTLPDDTLTFGAMVFVAILLIGALCFFPALVLGPIVEKFQH